MFKRWTVILIPHDRGERRTLNVSSVQAVFLLAMLAGLCITSGYFYRQGRSLESETRRMDARNRELEEALERQRVPVSLEEHLAQKEVEIRAHYEMRDRVITGELARLYDLEREVRIISGLPVRRGRGGNAEEQGGKGGPPDDPDAGLVYEDEGLNPRELIYGIDQPSADLIIEEMGLRLRSLSQLVDDIHAQHHLVAHTPEGWPTEDGKRRINSRFGRRTDPITNVSRSHSGVDISASYGSSIMATANGVVVFSGYHQFLGHLVKVEHGYGLESWYGHMSKRLVQKGDVVKQGDVIGKVGSSGRSTGPHIHYEVHLNGARVDPRNYIGH